MDLPVSMYMSSTVDHVVFSGVIHSAITMIMAGEIFPHSMSTESDKWNHYTNIVDMFRDISISYGVGIVNGSLNHLVTDCEKDSSQVHFPLHKGITRLSINVANVYPLSACYDVASHRWFGDMDMANGYHMIVVMNGLAKMSIPQKRVKM